MITTDAAKEIRKRLKARGWTARDVSVRCSSYSMGSSITVTIKNPDISLPLVERLAAPAESISRCEMTGDILSGGNRFLHVGRSEECKAALAAPYVEPLRVALEKLQDLPTDRHAEVEIAGQDVSIVNEGLNDATLWIDGRRGRQFWTGSGMDMVDCAYQIALGLERKAA